MNGNLKSELLRCETDIEGALYRFAGNEELYVECLNSFLEDKTIFELECAIEEKQWDEAFTAAHALKGIAGNMGFVPLFHTSATMVVLIRTGRINEIAPSFILLKKNYDILVNAIKEII